MPNLAVALFNETSLGRPVLKSRWFPPTENFCRGAYYATFHLVGGSNLTLSLGGVVYSISLNDTSYSLPPTLFIR